MDKNSFFHYNISKPFPFRWFTPVAVIGGLLCGLFLTFANFGSSSYYLKTQYTDTPEELVTKAKSEWYLKAPWNWGDTPQTDFETASLSVGSQMFTTNLGFRYTLDNVAKYENESNNHVSLPSVPYRRQILENCTVNAIELRLRKIGQPVPPTSWWTWDDSSTVAYASCWIWSHENEHPEKLKLDLRTVMGNPTGFGYIINNNNTMNATSLWWGSRLLNIYYYGTLMSMAEVKSSQDAQNALKAMFKYRSAGTDPQSNNYFYLVSYIVEQGGAIFSDDKDFVEQRYNNASYFWSRPMTEGLQFAKMFRSIMEVDFGVNDQKNLLLDNDLLQYAINSPDDFNRPLDGDFMNRTEAADSLAWKYANGINGPSASFDIDGANTPVKDAYRLFKDKLGPLQTQPARLYAQYACSIPERKSMGSLLLALLLADLVFLQALWKTYKFAVETYLERTDPQSNVCEGCTTQNKTYHKPSMQDEESVADDASTTNLVHGGQALELGTTYLQKVFIPR